MGTVSFVTAKLQQSMVCTKFYIAIALLVGLITISIQNDETTNNTGENNGEDAHEDEPLVLEYSITPFNSPNVEGKPSRFGGSTTTTTISPNTRAYCPRYYRYIYSSGTCYSICRWGGYRYYRYWSSIKRCYCCWWL